LHLHEHRRDPASETRWCLGLHTAIRLLHRWKEIRDDREDGNAPTVDDERPLAEFLRLLLRNGMTPSGTGVLAGQRAVVV
jgi:hypothetical protein